MAEPTKYRLVGCLLLILLASISSACQTNATTLLNNKNEVCPPPNEDPGSNIQIIANVGDYEAISISNFSLCLLSEDHRVECWGGEELEDVPDAEFIDIGTGWYQTCGIERETEKLMCWGMDFWRPVLDDVASRESDLDYHELDEPDFDEFDEIIDGPPEGRFTSVDADFERACALGVSGAIRCWGGSVGTS